MSKPKRKTTAAQKKEIRERKKKFMTIFINGKQKRVPRPPLIDGLPIDEFLLRNADPIWLHENGLWERGVEKMTCDSNLRLDETRLKPDDLSQSS